MFFDGCLNIGLEHSISSHVFEVACSETILLFIKMFIFVLYVSLSPLRERPSFDERVRTKSSMSTLY